MQDVIVSKEELPHSAEIRDFILYRELNEVYLLLDHISGRWDKSFSSIEKQNAAGDGCQVSVKEICEIRWPNPDDQKKQAEMAEVLLRAKDKLNAAARPANGLTIAFTLMVVGESDPPMKLLSLRKHARQNAEEGAIVAGDGNGALGSGSSGASGGSGSASQGGGKGRPPTRVALAHEAFPGMIESAADFRRRIRRIVYVLSLLLVLTCLLSWYSATMSGILTRMDTVHAQARELENKMALMVVSTSSDPKQLKEAAQAAANAAPAQAPRTAEGASTLGLSQFSSNFCSRSIAQVGPSEKTADAISVCSAREANHQDYLAIWKNLGHWLPWRVTNTPEGRASDEEGGRIVTQLLINSILPFFYGILGAGAAVVRDLWAKTRESLLSPRDSTLALGQLALGAIIGACIGLFVNPTSAGAASGSLLASLALTASALAFVAGFGVEGAFLALESLVRRVFNQTSPGDSRSQPR